MIDPIFLDLKQTICEQLLLNFFIFFKTSSSFPWYEPDLEAPLIAPAAINTDNSEINLNSLTFMVSDTSNNKYTDY